MVVLYINTELELSLFHYNMDIYIQHIRTSIHVLPPLENNALALYISIEFVLFLIMYVGAK